MHPICAKPAPDFLQTGSSTEIAAPELTPTALDPGNIDGGQELVNDSADGRGRLEDGEVRLSRQAVREKPGMRCRKLQVRAYIVAIVWQRVDVRDRPRFIERLETRHHRRPRPVGSRDLTAGAVPIF